MSKLVIPVQNKVFYRDRLDRQLSKGLRHRLIWINGPGGSGKTTLVSSFIRYNNLPHLWYTLNKDDSDISSFFYCMSIAVGQITNGTLKLFTPTHFNDLARFTKEFFHELCDTLPKPFTLVFDEYHTIAPDSSLHSVLFTALSMQSFDVNIIVISRENPHTVYSPLRVRNEIFFVAWEDIKFTFDETVSLLKLVHGNVSSDQAENVFKLSDGWVSALITKLENMPGFSFNKEIMFDYFTSEIFSSLDDDMRKFLIISAILRQMTIQMAKEITDYEDAPKALNLLVSRNCFTTKDGLVKETYRYHPLFRWFLLDKADSFISLQERTRIYNKAITLLIENEFIEDAASLSIERFDWNTLYSIILKYAEKFLRQGRVDTLLNWLNTLPENFSDKEPWISYFRGYCFLTKDTHRGLTAFEKAFDSFLAKEDLAGAMLAWSGVVDTIFMERADFSRLDKWINWLNKTCEKDKDFSYSNVSVTVVSAVISILIFRKPDMKTAVIWLSTALKLLDGDTEINTKLALSR